MQTKIGETLYVTKFFYGKHKNPSNGKWRNRSTTCKIFKLNGPGKIIDTTPELGFFRTSLNLILGNETETKITKIPADMTQLSEGKVRNCHGEPFVRAVGRKLAFQKALENPTLNQFKDEFMKSFELQCPSSVEKIVESVRQKKSEVKA